MARADQRVPTRWNPNNIPEVVTIQGEEQRALRVDDSATPVSYIGEAPVGSATSAAVWRIKKVDETSGTIVTWADGNSQFDNIWDNRASLTYS